MKTLIDVALSGCGMFNERDIKLGSGSTDQLNSKGFTI
jgi:hypothetical protein